MCHVLNLLASSFLFRASPAQQEDYELLEHAGSREFDQVLTLVN